MAVRTTNARVLQIMDNCTTSTTIIDRLITAASAVVDKVFESDSEISDTLLEEIECWLTAHMLASTLHRSTTNESLGDASVTYTGSFGEGLKSTPYGQMVLSLDTSGKMLRQGKQVASIYAIPSFDD